MNRDRMFLNGVKKIIPKLIPKIFLYLVVFFSLNGFLLRIFFVLYHYDSFRKLAISDILLSIVWGFRFDIAIASIVSFILSFLIFNKKVFLSVGTFILVSFSLSQISDIMYFEESRRHIGYEVGDAILDFYSLLLTALSQHLFLMIFSALYVFLIVKIFLYFFSSFKDFKISFNSINIINFFKFFSVLVLTLIFIRGGLQEIILEPIHAYKLGNNKMAMIALNANYNMLYEITHNKNKLKNIDISKSVLLKKDLFNLLYKKLNNKFSENKSKFKRKNIVIIFLEGWSAVQMKSYGYYRETTPFFDSLLKKSLTTIGMVAGGHRTTEGMFSTLCSFQNPLGKTIAQTNLQNYNYRCLPHILKENGWDSAFFQGTLKETSGTGAFAQKLGFKKSYGKGDIPKKTLKYAYNSWGVYDQDLFAFVNDQANKLKKPFLIGINTNTTHDLNLPKNIKFKFRDDKKKSQKDSVMYFADLALKKFINSFQKRFSNTLFVLVADHTSSVVGSSLDNYLIPFLIYEKDIKPKKINIIASQRDISPTILDFIQYNKKEFSLTGKSILNQNKFFADYYHNGIFGWIEKNKNIEFNINNGQMECFNLLGIKQHKNICDKSYQELKQIALSFTKYSQDALFEGKTINFLNLVY